MGAVEAAGVVGGMGVGVVVESIDEEEEGVLSQQGCRLVEIPEKPFV